MVDVKKHPAYLLNRYVWELLTLNNGLKATDYNGATPIVPANMEPEFTALNKPFLVYGYSGDGTGDLHALKAGSLSYAVWSTSVSEINAILNTITTALETHDIAAREVTRWTEKIGANAPGDGFRFDDIYISYLEGPSPEESENGRQAGIITIRYQYTADYKVILPS